MTAFRRVDWFSLVLPEVTMLSWREMAEIPEVQFECGSSNPLNINSLGLPMTAGNLSQSISKFLKFPRSSFLVPLTQK
jgi:uncharacterized membrane protein AbrB (regulator of aidB expression)